MNGYITAVSGLAALIAATPEPSSAICPVILETLTNSSSILAMAIQGRLRGVVADKLGNPSTAQIKCAIDEILSRFSSGASAQGVILFALDEAAVELASLKTIPAMFRPIASATIRSIAVEVLDDIAATLPGHKRVAASRIGRNLVRLWTKRLFVD
jgi:hypothetical protein